MNGVWRYVIVDQFVPVNSNGKIAFTHSYDDPETESWVTIIEKAYTKSHGNSYAQYSR